MHELQLLSDDDLKELGIPIGPRCAIQAALAEPSPLVYREASPPSECATPETLPLGSSASASLASSSPPPCHRVDDAPNQVHTCPLPDPSTTSSLTTSLSAHMPPSGSAGDMAQCGGIAGSMAPPGIADGMSPSDMTDGLEGCSPPSGPCPMAAQCSSVVATDGVDTQVDAAMRRKLDPAGSQSGIPHAVYSAEDRHRRGSRGAGRVDVVLNLNLGPFEHASAAQAGGIARHSTGSPRCSGRDCVVCGSVLMANAQYCQRCGKASDEVGREAEQWKIATAMFEIDAAAKERG